MNNSLFGSEHMNVPPSCWNKEKPVGIHSVVSDSPGVPPPPAATNVLYVISCLFLLTWSNQVVFTVCQLAAVHPIGGRFDEILLQR